MAEKFKFYERYGVEEYYVLIGWLRTGNDLDMITEMDGWMSPRLKIKF